MSLPQWVRISLTGLMLGTASVSFGQQPQAPYYGSQIVRGPTTRQAPLAPTQAGPRVPGQAYTVPVTPCGVFGKPPCGTVVTIPAGATGQSLFAMAKTSDSGGRSWEAIIYVDQAAILGYAPAQAALGEDFVEGRGVPQNLTKGRYWLGLAADQGDVPSEAAVGEMYERALGGPPDLPKAVHYYELAAAQHSARAEFNLGLDYELAYGVPHDRAKAIAMLRRAAADGSTRGAAVYANALGRAKTAQFRSQGELDAFVYPAPPAAKRGPIPAGCPGEMNYSPSTNGFMYRGEFCNKHPGCPYQMSGVEQVCPQYHGPTLDQLLHDN